MKSSTELYKEYLEALKAEKQSAIDSVNKELTPKQTMILELFKNGRSKLGIAKDVGVSRMYVYEILIKNGLFKTDKYKHIKRKTT